jgi:hypothetical protein
MRVAADSLRARGATESIPAGEIEVPEFQAKRRPQLIETAQVARESRANKATELSRG